MNFKKLSIIFLMAILIFTSSVNISSAIEISSPTKQGNEYINDLNMIDNNMYMVIKLISKDNLDKDDAIKQINYADSLIKGLHSKISKLSSKEDDVILSIRAVLSFYKLSLLKAEDYIQTRNTEDLIDSISTFSIGYNASTSLRKIINEAGK